MLTMGHGTNDYILVMFHILEGLYDPPRFQACCIAFYSVAVVFRAPFHVSVSLHIYISVACAQGALGEMS